MLVLQTYLHVHVSCFSHAPLLGCNYLHCGDEEFVLGSQANANDCLSKNIHPVCQRCTCEEGLDLGVSRSIKLFIGNETENREGRDRCAGFLSPPPPPPTGRERPIHSPAKEHELPRNERKSQAPRRQKTDFSIFQPSDGQAYRDQTKPKPNQNHSPEKATPEKKTPIFGVIGKGFTFAPTTRQQNLLPAWMKG